MITTIFIPEDNEEKKILANAVDMYSCIFSLKETIRRHLKDGSTAKQSKELLEQIQLDLQYIINKIED